MALEGQREVLTFGPHNFPGHKILTIGPHNHKILTIGPHIFPGHKILTIGPHIFPGHNFPLALGPRAKGKFSLYKASEIRPNPDFTQSNPMPLRHAKWTKRARWNRRQFELSKHPSHPSRLQILWSKMWSKGTLDRKGRISQSAHEFLACMEQHRANSRAMRLGNPPPYPELVEEEPLPPNKEKTLVAPLPPNQYIDGTSHQIADSITRPCPDQTALVVYKVPKETGKSTLVMYHHDQLTAGNADDYEIDDFVRPDDEIVCMQPGDEPVAPRLQSEAPPSDVPQLEWPGMNVE